VLRFMGIMGEASMDGGWVEDWISSLNLRWMDLWGGNENLH
jgi:hypothetical protein